MSANSQAGRIRYAHVDERIQKCDHRFVVDGFWNDSGRRNNGDDVWHCGPTAYCPSDQNTGEQDGCEEEMTGVFSRSERTGREARLARVRVEWDVLDVLML